MIRIEDILDGILEYSPNADIELIKKAYVYSASVHSGQVRKSGEPYFSHPIEVARILLDMKLDSQSISAALLHDTVEDTHSTTEEIEEKFGAEVAGLVEGLTKLGKLNFTKKEDREAENFRKMLLAMATDIRVILIKLADRLHNMSTLEALSTEKQIAISRETLDIYAPLANRLGIGWIKTDLEDLSFKYLKPDLYKEISDNMSFWQKEKGSYIDKIIEIMNSKIEENRLKADIKGRFKHIYSIFRKMEEQDIDFDNVNDLIAFRIIAKNVRSCYTILGIMHSMWKPVPGRFKDYIAIPKANLYQSLHTTVVGPFGWKMEVQIRTEEMNRIAENGIAAHWKYKEGKGSMDKMDTSEDTRFAWLRQLLKWQRDLKDSGEFLETIKIDLFPEEVFVFTPQGDVKEIPTGSTPVDFAYAIHSDIGNTCSGAKVNGRIVTLSYRLKNGETVEILTNKNHVPNAAWLDFVVTTRARALIKHYVKNTEREQSIILGRELLEKELNKYNVDYAPFIKSGELENISREVYSFDSMDTLLQNIGFGKISIRSIVRHLIPKEIRQKERSQVSRLKRVFGRFTSSGRAKERKLGVVVSGIEGVVVRYAKCCSPVPGEEIRGFITPGRGVVIHTKECPNIKDINPERRVNVVWEDDATNVVRPIKLMIVCKNEKGLLADMSIAIKNADSNILSAEAKTNKEGKGICLFEVEVNNALHLRTIMTGLKGLKNVEKVTRVKEKITENEHN